jgi:5-methyltetrahydrofolate--homocysteine methyltransferase
MEDFAGKIALCVERGKINKASVYPPDMKGQDGGDELAKNALAAGVDPKLILDGCMKGMSNVGVKFSQNKVFVPDLLMAAKTMKAVMAHLAPFFKSGAVKAKGTFVLGTVAGDLHDIGKNLVGMTIEGAGWKVVDIGVDTATDKFLAAAKENPGCVVGLSALLTTTMVSMEKTVKALKEKSPKTKVIVGGAPLTAEYAKKIGADGYSPHPQGAVDFLNTIAA